MTTNHSEMSVKDKILAVNTLADWAESNPGKTFGQWMLAQRRAGADYLELSFQLKAGQKFLNDEIFSYNPQEVNGGYDFVADGVSYHYSTASGQERITINA